MLKKVVFLLEASYKVRQKKGTRTKRKFRLVPQSKNSNNRGDQANFCFKRVPFFLSHPVYYEFLSLFLTIDFLSLRKFSHQCF
jgi:hypothetical protein